VNLQSESVINISTKAVKTCLPDLSISAQEIVDLQKALKGVAAIEKNQRAKLIAVYFKIWDEFRRIHQGEPGLPRLETDVVAWAGRSTLYPPFQPYAWNALFLVTKRDWRWPFYLLRNIPYYRARRQIAS
jgi:hypothetical protein